MSAGNETPDATETTASDDLSAEPASTFEWLSLDEDEEIVWSGAPTPLAMGIGTIATGVILIPFFLIGLLVLVGPYLRLSNTEYVLTTKAVYERHGILSETIETARLDRIQTTEYSQSAVERQLGYGSVRISTAGSGGAQITFRAIDRPRDVQTAIQRLREGRGSDGDSGSRDGDGEADVDAVVAEPRRTREALEAVNRTLRER